MRRPLARTPVSPVLICLRDAATAVHSLQPTGGVGLLSLSLSRRRERGDSRVFGGSVKIKILIEFAAEERRFPSRLSMGSVIDKGFCPETLCSFSFSFFPFFSSSSSPLALSSSSSSFFLFPCFVVLSSGNESQDPPRVSPVAVAACTCSLEGADRHREYRLSPSPRFLPLLSLSSPSLLSSRSCPREHTQAVLLSSCQQLVSK